MSEPDDAATAAALYERMPTDQLLRLQRAHQLDQAEAVRPSSIAFVGGRLALIAAELKRRELPSLYFESPEIHAAVHATVDIATVYQKAFVKDQREARAKLFAELIDFFNSYDRMRSEEVESLKAQLVDALKWSGKPISLTEPPA
jgi:hypothetical protein